MTNNHLDQLAQWWENAEEGIGKAGDVIIEHDDSPNFETPSYVVFTLGRDEYENLTYRRILARAPKHKPAWHNAVAVIADADQHQRQVWVRESDGTYGCAEGYVVDDYELHDVTPLIEAKVTDETARTVLDRYYETETGHDWPEDTIALMRLAVTAALGLESA